jgi:hypothetical protein
MREVTYAQMHKVLSSLSFSIRVVTVDNKLRVYEHEETGARLWLAFRLTTRPCCRTTWLPCRAHSRCMESPILGTFAVELQKAS